MILKHLIPKVLKTSEILFEHKIHFKNVYKYTKYLIQTRAK